MSISRSTHLAYSIAGSVLLASSLLGMSTPAGAETRGYVIQWIHTATYPQPDNCPQGGNGGRADIQRHILLSRGYTPEKVDKIVAYYEKAADGGVELSPADNPAPEFSFNKRGTLFGKPVDVSDFPASEPDPQIETAQGHFMYGFNLTDKPQPYSFEDPDTHEMVEDQMWRVLGCFTEYRVPLSIIPYNEAIGWDTEEDAMPAWLMTVSGEDLSKDGDVTVTFDRALNLVMRNSYGGALRGASYTIDPNPLSHSVFKGHINNQTLSIEPGNLFLLGEVPKFYPVLRFTQAHLRVNLNPAQSTLHYGGAGVVSGLVGGYEPWLDYWHYSSIRGESGNQVDIAGLYYAMKRLADAVPDPVTGQNTAISAVYYFEAAPVFVTTKQSPVITRDWKSGDAGQNAPATTPPGITLIEVARELNLSEPQILWLRPGDAAGKTLLLYDQDGPGSSACVDACAQEFPPLLAAQDAKAFGDWSLVRRSDGSSQWAYQSHPLYTWTKEQVPNEVATNVGLTETVNLKIAEKAVKIGSLLPPAGWKVARFAPTAGLKLPRAIDARLVPSAGAIALTDTNGLTLYAFSGNVGSDHQTCATSGCQPEWRPLAGPELGSGFGDFSIVTRADGARQWAYKKQALYTYSRDKLPGDALGIGVDKRWTVAVVTENFRPRGVSTVTLEGYGDVLAINGMTLYGAHPFESRNGGRNLRGSFANLYTKDKLLGPRGCEEEECLKNWRPFAAPADAKSAGFWEPITRSDGTKQWAYKGCALYTYAGDKSPGDHNGQGINDFVKVEGSEADLKKALFFVQFSRITGGLGVYWNVAKP
jgi:predicted lipoprotein with Yx(FWY)xxD motif